MKNNNNNNNKKQKTKKKHALKGTEVKGYFIE